VVLYLAEKGGKLIPAHVQGRTRVVEWCFAAVSSVEPTLVCLDLIDIFDSGKTARNVTTEVRKLANRWLRDVERRLEGRDWIACAEFTVADIMMACVLRAIRKTDLMEPFPRIRAYYERCQARPAWQRTLALYAERIGVTVDEIR
jgi:glutathione S-transferase